MKKQTNKINIIHTYDNKLLNIVIGDIYSGEGYSGLTDGVIVKGILTDVDIQLDSATIMDEKLQLPCAVKIRSLNTI